VCVCVCDQVLPARLRASSTARSQRQRKLETHHPRPALRRRAKRQLARIRLQLSRSTVGGKALALSVSSFIAVHTDAFGYAPTHILDAVVPVSMLPGRTHLRSADSGLYDVPRVSSSVGSRAFSVAGPQAWNQLLYLPGGPKK